MTFWKGKADSIGEIRMRQGVNGDDVSMISLLSILGKVYGKTYYRQGSALHRRLTGWLIV